MSIKVTAKYPSNIALVKYWGKYGNQLPCNASLSMTLTHAHTEVVLECLPRTQDEAALSYYFDGNLNPAFGDRVMRYVKARPEFSRLLDNFSLRFSSHNSFPHSTGIASSASAFAAIAAALFKAANPALSDDSALKEMSRLARLGSGSACRSFYGPYSQWGQLDEIAGSSNEFAIPVIEIHDNFKSMKDAIIIVESEPKEVSSSKGHSLMEGHPYAEARFKDANKHCLEMVSTLRNGDFSSFISITEREALSLHAMMMTSSDYYMLIRPQTVQIIKNIFHFRKDTRLPLCFTLDAGPNVHLLYPEHIEPQVKEFINEMVIKDSNSVIFDQSGTGGLTLNYVNGAA